MQIGNLLLYFPFDTFWHPLTVQFFFHIPWCLPGVFSIGKRLGWYLIRSRALLPLMFLLKQRQWRISLLQMLRPSPPFRTNWFPLNKVWGWVKVLMMILLWWLVALTCEVEMKILQRKKIWRGLNILAPALWGPLLLPFKWLLPISNHSPFLSTLDLSRSTSWSHWAGRFLLQSISNTGKLEFILEIVFHKFHGASLMTLKATS